MTAVIWRVVCYSLLGMQVAGAETTAEDVLGRVRTALGGTERLAAVRSLSLAGEVESTMILLGRTKAGAAMMIRRQMLMDILLPDSYVRYRGDVIASRVPMSISPDSVGMNAGVPWSSERKFDAAVIRNTLRRWLLLLMGAAPGVAWSYGGRANVGEEAAEVLAASTADGFAAQLYVNAESGLPLMLVFRRVGATGPPPEKPREMRVEMQVSHYDVQDGIRLPGVISYVVDGVEQERIEVERWRVNPALDAKHFRKR